MKNYKHLLIVCTVMVGIISAVLIGCFRFNYRMKEYEEQARSKFIKVLENEVRKREVLSGELLSNRTKKVLSETEKVNDTVIVNISGLGKLKYTIPPERQIYNIENSPECRVQQSYVFMRSPLVADNVWCAWRDSMPTPRLELSVRIGITDWESNEHFSIAGDTIHQADSDSLFSYYIGMRSEVMATGYVRYCWYRMFTSSDWILVISLGIFFCGIFLMIAYQFSILYRRLLPSKKQENQISQSQCNSQSSDKNHIVYQLPSGFSFNSQFNLLSGTKGSIKLTPQTALLLRVFLGMEHYQIGKRVLIERMWSDHSGTNQRLHSAISRLRTALKACGNADILDLNEFYELIFLVEEETA